jgi:gas vesicle protein
MTAKQLVNKGTVSSLFLGGLLGAGTALLFAPGSGKDTRRKIGHYTDEVTYKAGDYFRQGKDVALSAYEKGANYIGSGKNLIRESIEAGKKAYERQKERLIH